MAVTTGPRIVQVGEKQVQLCSATITFHAEEFTIAFNPFVIPVSSDTGACAELEAWKVRTEQRTDGGVLIDLSELKHGYIYIRRNPTIFFPFSFSKDFLEEAEGILRKYEIH